MSKSAQTTKSSKRLLYDVHSLSCVSCAESRLEFSKISWIQSNNFINSSRKFKVLEQKYCPQNKYSNSLLVFGKIRSRFRGKENQITDFIGKYNVSEKTFYMCGHDCRVYDFGFCSVLNIDRENSYEWVATTAKEVHEEKYALRVAYDTLTKNVRFAGCINRFIGSINSKDFELEVSTDDNKVEKLKAYDLLCLKPSPASLKHLCRLKLRNICNKDNFRIKKLYRIMNPNLVDYLKYPNALKCSQCLLKGDSLVSENCIYKLSLLETGELKFYINDNNDNIFLYENVDCLNFNEFSLVVNFKDKTCKTFVTDFDEIAIMNYTESKLIISNDGFLIIQSPFYDFRFLIQFRDDLPSFLNLSKPNFVFTSFYEKVKDEDDTSDTDTDSESDSDCDSDDDSTGSSSNEIDEDEKDVKNSENIKALNKLLIGNRAKTAVKK